MKNSYSSRHRRVRVAAAMASPLFHSRSRVRKVFFVCAFSVQHGRVHAFSTVSGLRRNNIRPLVSLQVPVSIQQTSWGLLMTTRSSTQTSRDDEEFDDWKAGDVYHDLEELERAIALDKADLNLQHAERMEMLKHFASARRPIGADVLKYVGVPLFAAILFRLLVSTTGVARLSFLLVLILTGIMNVQFWTICVAAPILLLTAKRLTQPPPEPMPEALKPLDPDYLNFLTTVDYIPPERSCRDYVLFLLEYWTSAIATMATLGILQLSAPSLLATAPRYIRLVVKSLSAATMDWMGVAQLFTRVGVIASLYQNPAQVFQLRRSEQPLPKAFFPHVLDRLISSMIWILPLGLATDLFQILVRIPNEAVFALYTSIFVLGLGTWIRLNARQENDSKDGLTFAKLERLSVRKRWLYAFATLVFWKQPILSWMRQHQISMARLREFINMPMAQASPIILPSLTRLLTWTASGVFSLTGPLLHLRSFAKIVRIIYTHDLSLALDTEDFLEAMADEASMRSRMKWRYRLEFREDGDTKRIGQVLRKWRKGFWYWVFLEGSVYDQLWKERQQSIKETLNTKGWNLMDRILGEADSTNLEAPEGDEDTKEKFINRRIPLDEGKKKAMKRLAEKHQQDYERKEFEDPLGVALQQTLGIGLGFNFDHDSPLKKSKKPSPRRLQARAAKSAIRHIQQLYDSAAKELEAIPDPDERKAKSLEIWKRIEEEREFLAARMTELIPSNFGGYDEFKERVLMKRFQQKPQNYVRVSSHEFRAMDPTEAIESVERDLENFSNSLSSDYDEDSRGNQHLSSSEKNTGADSSRPPVNEIDTHGSVSDDEDMFLKSYLEKQKATLSGVHKDDDDTEIMLA